MSAPAAVPQRGGTADLDVLWDELAHWPGYYVSGISPAWTSGSRDRDDQYRPESGPFHTYDPSSWFVEVESEGWEPRDRWFMWGDSIAASAAGLAESMRKVRIEPHLLHLGLEGRSGSYYQMFCKACEDEAARFPDEDMEWRA